ARAHAARAVRLPEGTQRTVERCRPRAQRRGALRSGRRREQRGARRGLAPHPRGGAALRRCDRGTRLAPALQEERPPRALALSGERYAAAARRPGCSVLVWQKGGERWASGEVMGSVSADAALH